MVANGLDVRLGHVVESVDTSGDRAVVVTSKGRFEANAVIVSRRLAALVSASVTHLLTHWY